jgi:aspartate/methionine/tyrosine aminotransferase
VSGTSLTQMQLLGVGSETNVAEGYPRFEPSPGQAAILGRLTELMDEARRTPFPALEVRAHAAFLHALGQTAAPVGSGRIISFYSSTVATDVAAAALARRLRTVGLVHPVIDCIPALLRARGLQLVPLSERVLQTGDPFATHPEIEAVLIANPNNPTGTVWNGPALERLARACAERGAPMVIDQCFRAFDTRAQYDTYALLDATGVEYVIIEDTGKLWPTGGVKLGLLAWSPNARLDLAEVAADVLLTAPPFSALVVEQFALDMAAGGLDLLHQRIAGNRALLAKLMDGSDRAVPADGTSRVSVSRLRLGSGLTGTRLWGQLLRLGVHSVPCRPFYWADGRTGERFLRIALARERDVVERAALAVRGCVDGDR